MGDSIKSSNIRCNARVFYDTQSVFYVLSSFPSIFLSLFMCCYSGNFTMANASSHWISFAPRCNEPTSPYMHLSLHGAVFFVLKPLCAVDLLLSYIKYDWNNFLLRFILFIPFFCHAMFTQLLRIRFYKSIVRSLLFYHSRQTVVINNKTEKN